MMERLRSLLHLSREPLYANANALIANQVFSAGLGFVYWVLAARLYSTGVYGRSWAAISTLLLISGIAQLGFGGGMTRFLPRAGMRTRRLIVVSYASVGVMSVILSIGFVALGGVKALGGVLGSGPTLALWVVLASVAWSIFRLQDAVLIGLRQAKWVLFENTIYNVAKIGLLVIGAKLIGDTGIVGSYFAPTSIVIILCTWLIFGVFTRTNRLSPAPEGTVPLTVREVAMSSGGDHMGSLVAESASRVLPLIILAVLGADATAYFATAWFVATTLALLISAMNDSFTAEAAGDRARIGHYSRHILRYTASLIVPAAAVLALAAPLILTIFHPEYAAAATPLLRWLCLSSLLIIFNNWYLAYLRIVGRIRRVVWLQVMAAALLLGLTYVLLKPLGINGVAFAWMLSEAAITLFGLVDARKVLFGPEPAQAGASA